ncbi:hypothetical protein ACHQM5_002622 [Ranunculus cassubicifolius]
MSASRRRGGGGGAGGGNERRGRGRTRRRGGDELERPSSAERLNSEEWPEPFLEALICQVAHEASQNIGRLEAAAAISNLFQVCSTWRAISRSEHLWQTLTRHIWQCDHLVQHQTWREEYLFRHRTASNFHWGRAVYANIRLQVPGEEHDDNLICRRLALSDIHLACGLVDGSVRVFQLSTRLHIATYHPQPRDRLGHFSRAVSGIILLSNSNNRLVFASLDGDIHVAVIDGGPATNRRVHLGNVVNDGTLLDFAGCCRWWVGLYAGVPRRSFHIWNAQTEQLVFVGGSLTDPESVMGWHLLNELNDSVGRVRMLSSSTSSTVVACTSLGLIFLDVRGDHEITITSNEQAERGVIVDSLDVNNTQRLFLVVDNRRVARICRVDDFQEVCRFRVRSGGLMLGCINSGCAFIWTGDGAGAVRAWDTRRGQLLYNLTDSMRDPTALASDDRHVAVVTRDSTVHFWDFGVI